ncbi:ribonuclease II [Sulfuricella sp. T08]|uniref:ribonuclease catalytic domain-containing protein n=1 Tax=Sulfuricella sp. T08 TaxID=1632857 RepID=UPI000617991B|nr:RNB domain-containing ribonuclease [Sulfuricella sp. T08]GAO36938.1 ribonuclease II [Sulfuricella sp. T08]
MNVLYEEDGAIKVASVMADNTSSLQVETPHGKRSKIKAANVLLRFETPAIAGFMEAAETAAAELDPIFLWECCGVEEFAFADLGREYYGHAPSPVEAAAVALKLHGAPMYFYKKGKGHYKAAPEENLKAALASEEKKRKQAETIAAHVAEMVAGRLPEMFTPQIVEALLYAPDKNTLEFKALDKACAETNLSPVKLLDTCGAIPSAHAYHLNRFLREHFPEGTGFPEVEILHPQGDPAHSDAQAFSIDDAATTEIDDAFSIKRLDNGNWRIGVHIAAPGLGFAPGDRLDEIASRRLSTVYMPGQKITMLPEKLVERYTLAEGRRCPALSLYLEVTPEFAVVGQESALDHVEIAANLRHEALEPVFNGATVLSREGDYAWKDELLLLWDFTTKLKEGRGKGESSRNFPDYNFAVVDDRVSITERHRDTPIDRVVSELMIHTNATWGKELAEADYAGIYRNQEGGKVRMSVSPGAHQGLGVTHYMWSSSPLRRYVDLVNQRQLIARLEGMPAPYGNRDERLLIAMRDFDLAYEAYGNIQDQMERYWCLRWLQQEQVSETGAVVVKENLVKLDHLPLFTRVPSLPEVPPGSRVLIEVSKVDLLEVACQCRYVGPLEQ